MHLFIVSKYQVINILYKEVIPINLYNKYNTANTFRIEYKSIQFYIYIYFIVYRESSKFDMFIINKLVFNNVNKIYQKMFHSTLPANGIVTSEI